MIRDAKYNSLLVIPPQLSLMSNSQFFILALMISLSLSRVTLLYIDKYVYLFICFFDAIIAFFSLGFQPLFSYKTFQVLLRFPIEKEENISSLFSRSCAFHSIASSFAFGKSPAVFNVHSALKLFSRTFKS